MSYVPHARALGLDSGAMFEMCCTAAGIEG